MAHFPRVGNPVRWCSRVWRDDTDGTLGSWWFRLWTQCVTVDFVFSISINQCERL